MTFKKRSLSPRSRSREFALQALYQWKVGKNDLPSIDVFTRDLLGFNKCQVEHYDALFYGCAREVSQLDAHIESYLDRPLREISHIEHIVLWMGVYEYLHCVEVPWRVVLNEYIELTKMFGGTDGHKYVNGVLNRVARDLRTSEVEQEKGATP